MRYRCGPVSGTILFCVLSLMGISGEITVGWDDGQSVASLIFSNAVILMFVGFAAYGLNNLRGVRVQHRPDGSTVLKLPAFPLTTGKWWWTFPVSDIDSVSLIDSGGRNASSSFVVFLKDGERYTTDAISTYRSRRAAMRGSHAGELVERVRQDLGLPAPAA